MYLLRNCLKYGHSDGLRFAFECIRSTFRLEERRAEVYQGESLGLIVTSLLGIQSFVTDRKVFVQFSQIESMSSESKQASQLHSKSFSLKLSKFAFHSSTQFV